MAARPRLSACLTLALTALAAALSAQGQRILTIDTIYDSATRTSFSGTAPPDITWIDADTYITAKRAAGRSDWVKVDAASGRESSLVDTAKMEAALAALPGVTRDEAARGIAFERSAVEPAHNGALVTIADDLYFMTLAAARPRG
jgi:hypothetical protein